MVDKKNKGKKKKGNQSKHSGSVFTAEDINGTKPNDSVSNADVLPDNYHGAAPVQNHHSRDPSNADSQSVGVSESDVDQEKLKNIETKCVELREEISKLEVERNILSQGNFEERIRLLENEVDSCILKEASLEEKISDLQSKNAFLTMREDSLVERIKFLQNEVGSCIQKEASLEEKIDDLQNKNVSMTMREVMELKDSRDSLAQENKQLTDSLSTLESRIQHLEMVASFYSSSKIHGGEKSHLKPAEASTMAHIPNEDSSEKASEIHIEPLKLAGTAENPASDMTIKNSSTVKSSITTDHAPELHKTTLESNEEIETNESFSVDGVEDLASMEQLQQIPLLGLDVSRVSEDVVSGPLDDIIQEVKPTGERIEAEPVVPLSDAPLIGAPFRLISFVARFVSGADLVDQDKQKPDR